MIRRYVHRLVIMILLMSATTSVALTPDQSVAQSAGTPVADYRFRGTFDSVGDAAPALVPIGPSSFQIELVDGISRSVLALPTEGGLTVDTSGLVPHDTFTIAMLIRISDTDGWRKIVDTTGGNLDAGLHVAFGALVFWPTVFGPFDAVGEDTYVQVVMTRDSSGLVSAYVDGVPQISFLDSRDDAVEEYFNEDGSDCTTYGFVAPCEISTIGADETMMFFVDDVVTGGIEDAAGAVARIRLYDMALTADEVAALDRLPTPIALTQALIQEVSDFVDQGILNRGEVQSLSSKLDAAIRILTNGNQTAAVNQLNAFGNQVRALVRSGRLPAELGQSLIDGANSISAQIVEDSVPAVATLRLTVLLDGDPVGGAIILVSRTACDGQVVVQSTTTSDGRIEVELPAGTYCIWGDLNGDGFPFEETIALSSGDAVHYIVSESTDP